MKVFVYYNLHKKCWSVKALEGDRKGRVIAHVSRLKIQDATFKVSQAGRARVLAEKRKNVHAGVVGQWELYEQDYDTPISYNPYKFGYFYRKDTLEAIYTASEVAFNERTVTMLLKL